jgi:hypothetical protein
MIKDANKYDTKLYLFAAVSCWFKKGTTSFAIQTKYCLRSKMMRNRDDFECIKGNGHKCSVGEAERSTITDNLAVKLRFLNEIVFESVYLSSM